MYSVMYTIQSYVCVVIDFRSVMSHGSIISLYRLRHLRTNSAKPTSASTFGVYNSLPYQPLSDEPLFTLAHHTVQTGTTG